MLIYVKIVLFFHFFFISRRTHYLFCVLKIFFGTSIHVENDSLIDHTFDADRSEGEREIHLAIFERDLDFFGYQLCFLNICATYPHGRTRCFFQGEISFKRQKQRQHFEISLKRIKNNNFKCICVR